MAKCMTASFRLYRWMQTNSRFDEKETLPVADLLPVGWMFFCNADIATKNYVYSHIYVIERGLISGGRIANQIIFFCLNAYHLVDGTTCAKAMLTSAKNVSGDCRIRVETDAGVSVRTIFGIKILSGCTWS